jgi:hypothetical protein
MKRRLLNYDSTPKFSVIKTATAKGSSSSVATITGIPTDGSVSLIVVSTAYYTGGALSDTSGNVYLGATPHTSSGIISKTFYMPNPIVTSSMTFTFSAAFGAIAVMILTGNPSSPNPNLDQQNGNNGGGTSLSSNSVTPTTNNQFIVAGAATGNPSTGTPPAVSGYTLLNVPFIGGGNQGLVTYYQVQTAATATSVTFSGPSITYYSAGIASFIN